MSSSPFISKPWVGLPAFEALANAATLIRFAADCDQQQLMRQLQHDTAWATQELGIRPGNREHSRRFDAAMDERARILNALLYDDYLQTDHWKLVRACALRRGRNKCALCSRTYSLHVHHNTYATRGEELPEDLTVLCEEHHHVFHLTGALSK